jgi:hypothetical protein
MFAATEFGSGNVFVTGDNAFHDDYLQYSGNVGNLNLFLSAASWASSDVNP